MVIRSMRRPAPVRNATMRPRKSASVSACGQPRPVEDPSDANQRTGRALAGLEHAEPVERRRHLLGNGQQDLRAGNLLLMSAAVRRRELRVVGDQRLLHAGYGGGDLRARESAAASGRRTWAWARCLLVTERGGPFCHSSRASGSRRHRFTNASPNWRQGGYTVRRWPRGWRGNESLERAHDQPTSALSASPGVEQAELATCACRVIRFCRAPGGAYAEGTDCASSSRLHRIQRCPSWGADANNASCRSACGKALMTAHPPASPAHPAGAGAIGRYLRCPACFKTVTGSGDVCPFCGAALTAAVGTPPRRPSPCPGTTSSAAACWP